MATSKNFLIQTSLIFTSIGDVLITLLSEVKNFIDFYFVFGQGSSFIKAHCSEVSCLDCLFGFSAKDIFPFESD